MNPGTWDLSQLEALGLYMEFEGVGAQLDAAISHVLNAQKILSEVVMKDVELMTAGKEVPQRPVADHTTRSYLSGLLTGLSVQMSLAIQVVYDVQNACAMISPNCEVSPTVN